MPVRHLIEVSGRFDCRSYRIYRRGKKTDIFERGKLAARGCLHLPIPYLPRTDRVIAEYFLIRGDERSYLATANITRCYAR